MRSIQSFANAEGGESGLRSRKDVPVSDQWDLTKLYATEAAWESDLERYRGLGAKIPSWKGTLGSYRIRCTCSRPST